MEEYDIMTQIGSYS